MKRMLAFGAILVFLTACSAEVELGDSPAAARCGMTVDQMPDRGSVSALVLMAQSVPSASLLPCVHALPAGWNMRRFEASDQGAHFWLASDRHGKTAIRVALSVDCQPGQATPIAAKDLAHTTRYDRIREDSEHFTGDRFYRYPGGCVAQTFDLRGPSSGIEAAAILPALGFVTRDAVRRYVHDYGEGHFELDPT